MRIALLNLPFDNNYGGNLQRYALMKVLTDMGHDVTHINLRYIAKLKWYIKPLVYAKRFVLKYFLRKNIDIDLESSINIHHSKINAIAESFYEKYIKHTLPCFSINDVIKETENNFDVFVVGSDQVWRKSMTTFIGIENYFFAFLDQRNVKRIAYAASLGTEKIDFSKSDIRKLVKLYGKFDKVSVRELSSVCLLKKLNWTKPNPIVTLDPTFLLNRADYEKLFDYANTISLTNNKIYCYILDQTSEILNKIVVVAKKYECEYIINNLDDDPISIEQWLRNIYDAKYIITDSFHGSVFSIIFNKPFEYCGNVRRGNERIVSLFEMLNINDSSNLDYKAINSKIEFLKKQSLEFLSF